MLKLVSFLNQKKSIMDTKNLRHGFGIIAFAIATITYLITVQDSVPFWDCSEFSAAAILQQVPHPPGAPLFLLVGKMFDLLIPFGDPGWKLNLLAVFSSSFTVWLLYYIITMVINNLNGKSPQEIGEAIAVYGAALVGASALTFSDTFWFNAVESEVYASSALFVAIIAYLMLRWNEEADNPGHERFLLLIAYLIGLSTGVHLLAILAIFSITYLVYFRKYEFTWKGFTITSVIMLFIFAIIYPGIVKWLPALLAGHTPQKTPALEYVAESAFFTYLALAGILLMIYLMYMGYKSNNKVLTLGTSAFLLILLGYSTYTQILIRSNANPPMNENEPKTFNSLASYLGREQYGNDASWPRRIKTEPRFTRNYLSKNNEGEFIYGDWYPPGYKTVSRSDGRQFSLPEFDKVNTAGEIMYLWKYQMVHMYFRYLFWNYVGKSSDVQDTPFHLWGNKELVEQFNYKSGYEKHFPIQFFAIPLIIGLIGMFFQLNKDPKMGFVLLLMFLMMGVLAAIAQQQQDPQPRERDYFYTGSFLVWCLWIGMGVYGLISQMSQQKFKAGLSLGAVIVSAIIVPVNMAYGGWKSHDRSGNYIPFDYSYNILQSADEGAIIFTNGDNDTFPVWYIQDVMGVRRDVRIVNLSLANTLWYVDQLKNRRPWGTEKIPLDFTDESLRVDEFDDKALSIEWGPAKTLRIPVKQEILRKYTQEQSIIDKGGVEITVKSSSSQQGRNGQEFFRYRVQDQVIHHIVQNTQFERPVYFSTTVGSDAYGGLEKYFRYEGMLMRICPVPQGEDIVSSMDIKVMEKCLMNIDNSDNYSKTPKFGFKLRNLNNSGVYYDPVHRRLMSTYRELYRSLARAFWTRQQNKEKAIEVLNYMNELISVEQFPLDYPDEFEMARFYEELGDKEKQKYYQDLCLQSCMNIVSNDHIRPEIKRIEATGRFFGPHRIAGSIYRERGDYNASKEAYKRLLNYSQAALSRIPMTSDNQQEVQITQYNIVELGVTLIELEVDDLVSQGKIDAARELLDKELEKYQNQEDQQSRFIASELFRKYIEIQRSPEELDSVILQ